MSSARHRLLWIDARTRRDSPSASVQARAAFDVINASLAAAPAEAAEADALVVEIDRLTTGRLDALRRAIACALARERTDTAPRAPARPASTAPALAYIEAHLDGQVSLDGAATACRLSPCELSRRFHREQRETFSAYVLRRRIERARELLASGTQPVSRVAYAVGFNDLSYFARVFRRQVGMPATAYVARVAARNAAIPAD